MFPLKFTTMPKEIKLSNVSQKSKDYRKVQRNEQICVFHYCQIYLETHWRVLILTVANHWIKIEGF